MPRGIVSESCWIKPNLDCNYTFPNDVKTNQSENGNWNPKFSSIPQDSGKDFWVCTKNCNRNSYTE